MVQMKNSKNLIVIFHSISNETCKPFHLNCEIKHNSNVMVCSIDLKYYEILQLNFCCFSSVPLQFLINNPVFYYNICGFSAER